MRSRAGRSRRVGPALIVGLAGLAAGAAGFAVYLPHALLTRVGVTAFLRRAPR